MLKRIVILWIIGLLEVLVSGCLTPVKTNMVQKIYIDPQISVERGNTTGYVVALREVECSKAIGNYITYLKNGNSLYIDERNQWAEHPSEVIFRIVYLTLKNTNRFVDVADAIEVKNPDLIALVKLDKFFIVDALDRKEVVFSAEFKLRDTHSGKLVVEKRFEISKPVDSNSDYVNTMHQVLFEFSKQLALLVNSSSLQNAKEAKEE